jgi:hypothetical protein
MPTASVFCVHILNTGSAFGARTDNGEQVFIPPTVARSAKLAVGETVETDLIPNVHHTDQGVLSVKTPWFATHVVRTMGTDLDSKAYSIIVDTPTYLTTAELAAELNVSASEANATLNRLFKAGRISKADVIGKYGQPRPSFCLWAAATSCFIATEE